MEIEIASPNEKEKMQMRQFQAQAAPLAQQQKGMAGQMGDMVKQKLMSDAAGAGAKAITAGAKQGMSSMLAPTVASGVEGGAMLGPMAGSGAMAGMATAVPYVGAGLLAGKALGLFNEGGQVGPLSTQYKAGGGYSIPNPNLSEAGILNAYDKYLSKFNEPISGMPNMAMPFDEFKLALEQQEAIKFNQGGQVSMNDTDEINKILDEIEAESMVEGYQQEMPMPKMRPPLMVDPMGADTTYNAEMYKPMNT